MNGTLIIAEQKMRGNAKNLPFTHSNSDLVGNLINEPIDLPTVTCVTISEAFRSLL
jgi:hypothetical protein